LATGTMRSNIVHHSNWALVTSEKGQDRPIPLLSCMSDPLPIASRIATTKIPRQDEIPSDVGYELNFDRSTRARIFRSVPLATSLDSGYVIGTKPSDYDGHHFR
jgi:hypothetical protein